MNVRHESVKSEIISHLEGLNELERQSGIDKVIETLAQRLDTTEEIIKMAIAEWEAGKDG